MWGVKRSDPNLAPLTLTAGRIVEDFSVGLRESATRGRGAEFLGYRKHQSTDTPRDIAWRASARLPHEDEIVSNVFAPERHMRVLIVADERISMRSPGAKPLYALSLVQLLALSAAENSDPFAVLGVGGDGMIFSGWLSHEEQLDEFLYSTDDKRLRAAHRPSVNSLSEFLDEHGLMNTIVIFLMDLSKLEEAPSNVLREFDVERLNATCIAVVLDEWSGFVPSGHLIAIEHPETGKRTVMDMREGGEISKEVAKFNERIAELKVRGKPSGLFVLTVPLASPEPFRHFYRQWLKHFEG